MDTDGARRLNRSSPSCLNSGAQRTDFFHGLLVSRPRRRRPIWTEASYWRVDEDLAQDYNVRLAQLFGGKVRRGRPKKDGWSDRWVARNDGTPFLIEDVANQLSGWRGVIEEFQSAVRARAQSIET